jgi:hypothetical protein
MEITILNRRKSTNAGKNKYGRYLIIVLRILVPIFQISCSSTNSNNYLIGVWKSDANKTLASLEADAGVSANARIYFKNKFFGRLIVEFTSKEVRSYFIDDKGGYEGFKEFHRYEIIEETNDYLLVNSFDDIITKTDVTVKYYKESENCYYSSVGSHHFNEYMCRYRPAQN